MYRNFAFHSFFFLRTYITSLARVFTIYHLHLHDFFNMLFHIKSRQV